MIWTIFVPCYILIFEFGSADGLYFHISETEKKCFIEEVPEDTLVQGSHKVQIFDDQTGTYVDSPSSIGMHVEVKDPDENVIMSKLYTSEGKFTFTSHSPGEHSICLYSNSTKWFAGKSLRINLDIQTGEHTTDYEQMSVRDRLTGMELRIRQLLERTKEIAKEQQYQRVREGVFRSASEATSNKVYYWSLIQAAVLFFTGFCQIRHLKSFFEAKKLV